MLPEDDRMIETVNLARNKVCFPEDDRVIETVTLARNKVCSLRMIV